MFGPAIARRMVNFFTAAAHAEARRRDRPLLGAWALVAAGMLCTGGALILLLLIEQHGVPGAGRPSAGHVIVRAAAGACLLGVGALMLAHLPRHPLSWIFCAAGLGTAVAVVGNQYAVASHVVGELPGAEWAGWLSEWVSFPVTFVPGAALLLFPDGRLPGSRWRAALWCGLAVALTLRRLRS